MNINIYNTMYLSIAIYVISFMIIEYYVRIKSGNNPKIAYKAASIIYRIWLLCLNSIILILSELSFIPKLPPDNIVIISNYIYIFNNYNNYPIFLTYSYILYYICRHCIRNQIIYMHMIHLYHPCKENELYGTYFRGIRYSLIDACIKYCIVIFFLVYNCVFISFFILTIDLTDLWFYYREKTDSTPMIFQTISQYLYSFIQLKSN